MRNSFEFHKLGQALGSFRHWDNDILISDAPIRPDANGSDPLIKLFWVQTLTHGSHNMPKFRHIDVPINIIINGFKGAMELQIHGLGPQMFTHQTHKPMKIKGSVYAFFANNFIDLGFSRVAAQVPNHLTEVFRVDPAILVGVVPRESLPQFGGRVLQPFGF